MSKEFIPYEQALQLKELGFDENCFGQHFLFEGESKTLLCYDEDQYGIVDDNPDLEIKAIPAPLHQQAFRWFREKYNLNYVIVKAESWFYTINGSNTQEGFNTYEEAELACLKKLIEIVNQNKEDDKS